MDCQNRKFFCEDLKNFMNSNSDYLAGFLPHLIQKKPTVFKLIILY
jgi:hypothetical protein